MKKLKLDSLKFNPPEMLSRLQLKNVMAGALATGSGGSSDCSNLCSGYEGRGTITHECDPCGLDKEKSVHDTAMCCL